MFKIRMLLTAETGLFWQWKQAENPSLITHHRSCSTNLTAVVMTNALAHSCSFTYPADTKYH